MNDQSSPARSTPSLVSDMLTQFSNLMRKEVALAKTEVSENLSRAGTALGLIAAGAIVVLVALNVLAAALVAGITELGLDAAWASLIVGLGFAVIAFVMVSKGINNLKLESLAPSRTAKNVRRDAETLKESLND